MKIRKEFFTPRVVRHWDRLPTRLLMAPSAPELGKQLGKVHRDMVGFTGRELDLHILVDPIQAYSAYSLIL